MKIASFNANGVRARAEIILKWLAENSPDVLCIQETKVQDADFPRAPFEDAGYHCRFKGQKRYNGVAVLSNRAPEKVGAGLYGDDSEEARLIWVRIDGVDIVNTYVPQGQAPDSDKFRYKISWLRSLGKFFETEFDPRKPLVWTGDFNVAPEPVDVHDPEKLLGSIGYNPMEHETLREVEKWGFTDVYRMHRPDDPTHTFWDYRIPNAVKRGLGWRIDHIWATAPMAERSKDAWIDVAPRLLPKPSDHTFIVADFN